MAEEKYFVDESGLARYHENYNNTILNTKEEIRANTKMTTVAGAKAMNELMAGLTAEDGIEFNFVKRGDKYGCLGADDSFIPFSSKPYQIKVSYRINAHNHGWKSNTAVFTRQANDTYSLTSGGSVGDSCRHIWESYHDESYSSTAQITGITLVYD